MKLTPLEHYTICYAPSLRVYYQLAQTSTGKLEGEHVLFVEDPDRNLGCSFAGQRFLCDQVQKRKLSPVLLQGSEITVHKVLEHMKTAVIIHYYGHGYYDWFHPDSSGVKMYSPSEELKLLKMEQISQTLSCKQGALVVLSACETGMTDVLFHWRDQYVGLPAGFLRAGAGMVVGSLWRVPNRETCILFSRFYQELFSDKKEVSPAKALRQAQLWMLKAGSEDLDEAARTYLGVIESEEIKHARTQDYRLKPAYWAAFYVVGNGFTVFK